MLSLTWLAFFIIPLACQQAALYGGDNPDAPPYLNLSDTGNDDQQNRTGQQLMPTTQTASKESSRNESRENSTFTDQLGLEVEELDDRQRVCQDPGNGTASTPAAEKCLDQQPTTPDSGKGNIGGQHPRLIDQGTVDEQTYLKIVDVTEVLTVVIGGAGLIENAVNMAVFARPSMRSPSSVILLYFSVAEFLFSLLSISWQILSYHYGIYAVTRYDYLMLAIYLSNYLRTAIRRWGYCLNLLVSSERFVAIAFPLRFNSLRQTRHPVVLSLALAVLMLLVHIYNVFKNDVVEQYPGVYRLAKSARAEEQGQLFETLSTVSKALFAIIPLLASLLINVMTMVALYRHVRSRQRLHEGKDNSQASQHERQTTVVILVSSMLFVLLSIPAILVSLLQNFNPAYGLYVREHFLYLSSMKLAALCEVASNITSFLVYLALSSRFRRELAAMFSRGRASLSIRSKVFLDNPVSSSRGNVTSTCAETSMAGVE